MKTLSQCHSLGIVLIVALGLLGCSATEEVTDTESESPATAQMPGFLDPAPPGPTSDTTILSGGTIVSGDVIADAVLVVTNGKLVAYGARGNVDIPNDSIGVDMRGKWIAPGVRNADGSLTLQDMPGAGQTAMFLIFSAPIDEQPEVSNLVGDYSNGQLNLNESD